MHSDPSGNWVLDAIFLAVDVAEMIRHPSVGNACWVLLDCVSFADATGALAAGSHALKIAHAAEETVEVARKSEHVVDFASHLRRIDRVKILRRGSTGRTIARSLKEKLAMEQVMSDPLRDAKVLKNIKMKDRRWRYKKGWVKMESRVNGVKIHFTYN